MRYYLRPRDTDYKVDLAAFCRLLWNPTSFLKMNSLRALFVVGLFLISPTLSYGKNAENKNLEQIHNQLTKLSQKINENQANFEQDSSANKALYGEQSKAIKELQMKGWWDNAIVGAIVGLFLIKTARHLWMPGESKWQRKSWRNCILHY
jgi:hypothetical protein